MLKNIHLKGDIYLLLTPLFKCNARTCCFPSIKTGVKVVAYVSVILHYKTKRRDGFSTRIGRDDSLYFVVRPGGQLSLHQAT